MKKSKEINELAAALSKAQSEMTGASKSSANPFFKSSYADLAECINTAKEPLANNELSVTQLPSHSEPGAVTINTVLMHSSGQWISSELTMKPDKPGPQAIGSCITYARRYAFAAIIGLAQEDDDGEAGMGRNGNGKAKNGAAKPKPAHEQKPSKVEKPEGYDEWWTDALKIAQEGHDAVKSFWSQSHKNEATKQYVFYCSQNPANQQRLKDIAAKSEGVESV